MAEKKSFVFYHSYEKPLAMLSDADRGKLLMALIRYSRGQEVEHISPTADMAFAFIRENMDRDAAAYQETVRKRSAAGKKGGRPPKSQPEGVPEPEEKANGFSQKQTKGGKAENENENENGNENENENGNDNENGNENTIPPSIPPKGEGAVSSQPAESGFDEFWQSYPRKVGKKAAQNAWKRLKPNAALRIKIMEALQEQKASRRWQKEQGRYIPNPATWLNQERWEDQLEEAGSAPDYSHFNLSDTKGETVYGTDFTRWELPD